MAVVQGDPVDEVHVVRSSPAPGPEQQGPARPLPDILAHRGTPDRGTVHQEPVPAVSGPSSVHQLPREHTERGISPARTARPASPRPRRAADTRLEGHYAVRSGVEGTIDEFAHGHGMCHCRYRGRSKAHLQHVLTAIAVNIERLSGGAGASRSPRRSSPGRSW
ncbi:transposase [Streptomyces europaeiscabiei]|uniref:transposase n=1 Tax=Streptomyces europaeiscabiei TaxID=146819 RepID=UPI0038F60637